MDEFILGVNLCLVYNFKKGYKNNIVWNLLNELMLKIGISRLLIDWI